MGAQPHHSTDSETQFSFQQRPEPLVAPLAGVVGPVVVIVVEIRVDPAEGWTKGQLSIGSEVILDVFLPEPALDAEANRNAQEIVGFVRDEVLAKADELDLPFTFFGADVEV